MPDYKTDQDWLMSELEQKQQDVARREIEDAIAGINGELRSTIVKFMRMAKAELIDIHASECFARWKAGYRAQKPGAIKMLEMARQSKEPLDL
jgi:hypothetical protein